MSAYRSFVVNDSNGSISSEITIRNSRNLPAGGVLVKVKYSSLNYFDSLAVSGNKAVVKKYPHTPGIDAAGIVIESESNDFHAGDEVVITGYGLGVDIPGGFGEYVRVPADWVISLPTGLTLKDCMTIGADGLAATIAVMDLLSTGVAGEGGDAIVSGAMCGTGSFAAAILAKCGFSVTAVTKTLNAEIYLKTLGVKDIVLVDKFVDNLIDPLLNDKYIVGVDTLGGNVLSTIVRSLKKSGSVAVCYSLETASFSVPTSPFFTRGVNILGIDSMSCPIALKKEAWYRLAGEWYIKALPMMCTEISLGELAGYASRFMLGDIKGRIVVNHEL